jgi:NTP pyrophosphatase (non-canonical NTP hydrolase)
MASDWPADLQERLRDFARARDWERYHTPRNLAALIASEAGELLALFRWDQDAVADRRRQVEEEVADVLLGVLRFADVADIDLREACLRKLEKNAAKYPAGPAGADPASGPEGVVVCGIDAGTFSSNSYVAWLRGREFRIGRYRPSTADPLPETPDGWAAPRVIALDLPQSLPRAGAKRREADAGASTPTSTLPGSRAELANWRLYRGLIEAGVETYWVIHTSAAGTVAGLGPAKAGTPLIVETYPRYVLKRLWPGFRIPSKRQDPDEYTEQVWALLEEAGYTASMVPGRPDHVDAMLCAIAARACLEADGLPAGTVGAAPYVDADDGLIREGYIVAP